MRPVAHAHWKVQRPILCISAIAWLVLIIKSSNLEMGGSCCPINSITEALSPDTLHQLLERNHPTALAVGWLLMLVAMMAPMLTIPIRYILDTSLARRRWRGVLLFCLGYTTVWMLMGILLLIIALILRIFIANTMIPIIAVLIVVVIWECSPWKQRCVNRGHALPALAAFGLRAELDALCFGLRYGGYCAGTCWALMLFPELFTRGHLLVMALATAWMQIVHLKRPSRPAWHIPSIGPLVILIKSELRVLSYKRRLA